jgi:hypothetical protein
MDVTTTLPRTERAFLLRLQRRAIQYFLDNQTAGGLVLDRQANHGPRRAAGLCSTAATGMGFIALAVATAEPHRLMPKASAVRRVRHGLTAALERVPQTEGVLPHFTHAATGAVSGADARSTVDTAWLVAGALWAAEFLGDAELRDLAERLYDRVHWAYWTGGAGPEGLIRHGHDRGGRFLRSSWDRLNGETVFLYVLAAGARDRRAWSAAAWPALGTFPGTVAGLRFGSADLGLFVFQYGLDLLDLDRWRVPGAPPGGADLAGDAVRAALANCLFCRAAAPRFATYRTYWGLSAGDGPAAERASCEPASLRQARRLAWAGCGRLGGRGDVYRPYSPAEPLDGTAHLTASLASVARQPALVLDNLNRALRDDTLAPLGRYGFSCVNVDHGWVGRDMVGIDAGAAVLALDNYLAADRVRRVFHRLPAVRRGLARVGFRPAAAPLAA